MSRGHRKRDLLALVILATVGCGGDDDDGPSFEITEQPLQGKINGADWLFVTGETDPFLSDGEEDFFALLYSSTFTPCVDFPPNEDPYLLVSVPKEPGDYTFDLDRSMTFVFEVDGEIQNYVTTRGRIVVYAVTSTSLSGGLFASFGGDPDFEVDGQFTLAVCP